MKRLSLDESDEKNIQSELDLRIERFQGNGFGFRIQSFFSSCITTVLE